MPRMSMSDQVLCSASKLLHDPQKSKCRRDLRLTPTTCCRRRMKRQTAMLQMVPRIGTTRFQNLSRYKLALRHRLGQNRMQRQPQKWFRHSKLIQPAIRGLERSPESNRFPSLLSNKASRIEEPREEVFH